jgi:hypothetical protein
MNFKTHATLKVIGFVAATLLATVVLIAAGLGGEDGPGLRIGWFGVSEL